MCVWRGMVAAATSTLPPLLILPPVLRPALPHSLLLLNPRTPVHPYSPTPHLTFSCDPGHAPYPRYVGHLRQLSAPDNTEFWKTYDTK